MDTGERPANDQRDISRIADCGFPLSLYSDGMEGFLVLVPVKSPLRFNRRRLVVC